MKPDIEYVYNKLKQLRFEFKEADRKLFPKEYKFDYGLDRYVRVDGNDLYISKDTFKPLEEELEYADKMHNLEEELGCPLVVVGKALIQNCFYDVEYNSYRETDIGFIPEEQILVISIDEWENGNTLLLSDYKKTWWLKEDKSE